MPVGRNFAVAPRVCALAGGIDPVRRDDTDDDMNFGMDIYIRLGDWAKTFSPIPIVTNPRREAMIVRDIIAGRDTDSRKSYENFHSLTDIYEIGYDDIMRIVEQTAAPVSDVQRCKLVDQYFQWVNKSRHKVNLDQCPGFQEVLKHYRKHEISYWQKEAQLCQLFTQHYATLSPRARREEQQEIVSDAIIWFNYFVRGTGHKFNSTIDGLNSRLVL